MEIVFRLLPGGPDAKPALDELLLRPANRGDADRIDLTALALEKGVAGFVRGEGPVLTIVAPLQPTVDDMLAVLILQFELMEEQRPAAEAFARYVASLRKGLRPTDAVPLEESLEGLFAHFRDRAGDLSDEARAARFLEDWGRLARILRPALARGADPHREVLFGKGSPFEAERQYLQTDRLVYERDRDAGERWRMQLPGEVTPIPALLLRRPRSALFKFWARSDSSAPGGKGFRFLAIWTGAKGPYEWVFSTDPLDRRPLDGLARALQAEEEKLDPERAAADPWYDGQRHGYTLVASPRLGTGLATARVRDVVRRWGKSRLPRLAWCAAAALVVMLVGAAFWPRGESELISRGGDTGEKDKHIPDERRGRGEVLDPEVMKDLSERRPPMNRMVNLAPNDKGAHAEEFILKNDTGKELPARLWVSFPGMKTLPTSAGPTVSVAGGPERPLKLSRDEEGPLRSEAQRCKLVPGNNRVKVSFPDPKPGKSFLMQLVWEPNTRGVIHLHVFAVGVSDYQHLSNPLKYADADARDVSREFARQKGILFDEVKVFPPLVNADATRVGIEDRLGEFTRAVKADPAPVKLAVVLFSGHGAIVADEYFIFLPYDYDERKNSTRLLWQNIEASLREMGCPALLLLDACHSGQAAVNLSEGSKGESDLDEAAKEFARQKPGIMVLASSLPKQLSYEDGKWGHGALSLTLLELLWGHPLGTPEQGLSLPNAGPVLNLHDLKEYADRRINELIKGGDRKQKVVLGIGTLRDARSVPLAVPRRSERNGQ